MKQALKEQINPKIVFIASSMQQLLKNKNERMKSRNTLLVICLLFSLYVFGQELNCSVNINTDQIQGTNKSVFNTLKKSVTELMNNRHWTGLTFATNERIECTMNIVVKKYDNDGFMAEITVQSRRPVYNASYTTTLLNFKDNDFNFNYKEFDQLEFVENSVSNNLTAMLAYYAYLIIGYDMDSFSNLGGNSYFQMAEKIVNSAQGNNLGKGWKAFDSDRNRYALINNLMDDAFKKFRNYFYEYHRMGLDIMSENPENGREKIFQGLSILRESNRARPSAVIISSFLDAKNDELINIFSKASVEQKKTAVEILGDVNPSYTTKYERIYK